MGIQARDRQDELFDLRHERRMLLCALTLSLCGDSKDRAEAKVTLLEFAKDPALAKHIVAWSEGLPNKELMSEDFQEVLEIARGAAVQSRTRVPVLVHQRA